MKNPGWLLYAIFDLKRPSPALAGCIGYLHTSTEHLVTEIGFIVILPDFQRSHVTSNAVGLLLNYALDPPEKEGLGLRRVQWDTNSENQASEKVALRMGFTFEGRHRWNRVFRDGVRTGKIGNGQELPLGANKVGLLPGSGSIQLYRA